MNKFNFNTLVFTVLAGTSITLLFSACSAEKASSVNTETRSFPTTQPILMDTLLSEEFVADIQSPQYVEIRARVRGYLKKIHVDEGQEVQKGQLLFTLSGEGYREELRLAEAAHRSAVAEAKMAEVEWKNTTILREKDIVSVSELELAEAKLEAALARVEEAKAGVSAAELNLSFTEIKAPFSGVINREPNKVGSLIEEGMLLTAISANHDVFAYFNVPEKTYLELMGKPTENWKKDLSLLLANGSEHPYPGYIETAETVVDKNTGNIAFRARFPNPEHLLKHGASGKIIVRHELKNALVIPQKSAFDVQDRTFIYVIGPDETLKRQPVVVKARLGHLYVIESGLTAQDQILFEGIQLVKEGDKVLPEMRPMAEIMRTLAMR